MSSKSSTEIPHIVSREGTGCSNYTEQLVGGLREGRDLTYYTAVESIQRVAILYLAGNMSLSCVENTHREWAGRG